MIAALVLVSNDEMWLPYALEASRGFFSRYVIYDVGSTDKTPDIIDWFYESQKGDSTFYIRKLPMVSPSVQGTFRNSMIAEALSEYYFLLDGDEIYTQESYNTIVNSSLGDKLYGVVRRIEVAENLISAYGTEKRIPHHRLYHRTAIWKGNHPGEVPFFNQTPDRELQIDATCYHFHNCERSSKDAEVPRRIERRARPTYRPGQPETFNVLKQLPILQKPIEDFPLNPRLKELQK